MIVRSIVGRRLRQPETISLNISRLGGKRLENVCVQILKPQTGLLHIWRLERQWLGEILDHSGSMLLSLFGSPAYWTGIPFNHK